MVRDYRRIKTRIKSFLLYLHVEIPEGMDTPKWPIKFLDWLDNLDLGQSNSNQALKSMVSHYRFIDLELKSLANQIRRYCKVNHEKDYELLRSVPGIAGLTAGYLLAELGDIRRFNSF